MKTNPVFANAVPTDGLGFQPLNPPSAPYIVASAVAAPNTSASATQPIDAPSNEAGLRDFLTAAKWPAGLQETLLRNLSVIPLRIFICDDSGSMSTSDGHMLVHLDSRHTRQVGCSRWAELASTLEFHSNLAYQANAPVEFRLLNGAAPIVVGNAADPDNFNNLTTFQALLKSSPSGGTPLCRHIREVTEKITAMAPILRARRQKVCVVILTDGESSDGDLATAMSSLRNLPVWVVVRLCTDEEKVVNYWNNIDNELELDMDVLDDLCGEAEEVHENNPWLTYGEPLHRLREFGIPAKEIDLLDETKLTLDQIRQFCALLLGGQPGDYPHPDISRSRFLQAVEQQQRSLPPVWNPRRKYPTPWINTRKLKGLGCTIM